MRTLAAFLNARINEDEAGLGALDTGSFEHSLAASLVDLPSVQARARREVEAKRKLVAMHKDCGYGTGLCDDGGHASDGSCGTLDVLAAVYSDHPDWRQDWKT